MMKTFHLFEEGYYLIGNRSVALTPLFKDIEDCQLFKKKIQNHLSPICDVMSFGLQREEFQLVIRLKTREEIERYFKVRYKKYLKKYSVIPETTYIFARAMADLQSGYAKKFNYKHERDGGLFASRYTRHLITSKIELDKTIEAVNNMRIRFPRSVGWCSAIDDRFARRNMWKVRSSGYLYEMHLDGFEVEGPPWFSYWSDIYVRGHFDNPPSRSISFKNEEEKIKKIISFLFMK